MKRLKVDLHIHTKYSKDGEINPEDLVKKAVELGFDAIAITDHGTIKGAIETKEIARKTTKDLIVFVGQEVKTKQGEVLIYNIRNEIKEEQDILKTCQEAKKNKGFLVVPHPFDLMRRGIGENAKSILGYVDAVEGFNARTVINGFNERAMEFAKENSKPMVAGSDAHFLDEFGKTYMLIESGKGERNILNAIEKNRLEMVMQRHGMKSGMKRGLRKIRTYF